MASLLEKLGVGGDSEATASSEIELGSMLEAVPQAMLAVSADGKIQLVNRPAEVIFGYPREELVGASLEMLVPKSGRATHAAHRESYFAEPKRRTMAPGRDLTAVRKDGTEFPVEVGLSFMNTKQGALTLAMISNVTERRRSAEELFRVNKELVRSNEALEQFVYVASHDLQEPLRTIASYLQLLERRYTQVLDDDGREFIRYAVDGATRMKQLLQDLLRVARAGQAADLLPVSGTAIFQTALNNLRGAISDASAVVTADPLPTIVADAPSLGQVLQNLIGNGIKFHAPGTEPRVHVSVEWVETEWIFSVRDNGIGIEPQHMSRIFEVFERLHSAEEFPGSGVGLSITRKIIERHGGRIWVESERGKGSVFRFSLPVDPPRAIAQPVKASAPV